MPNRPGRLRGFTYRGFNIYFITICTEKRHRAFDDAEFGHWAREQLLRLAEARDFEVIAYCLMPDHVHLLLRGCTEHSDLRSFILSWNTRTAYRWRQTHGTRLWQSGYYDHILRDDDNCFAVARYILMNPVEAGIAARPQDYVLCGSSAYDVDEILKIGTDWLPQ